MIPGDLLSAFPHRQFYTLPGLLDSLAALPNSNPDACMPMQGGSLYHFYDGLWYDPAERRTHYLPCERRTDWANPTRSRSLVVQPMYGAVYGEMHYKDILRSVARVGYCIPVPDFYLVLHGLWCQKNTLMKLSNQSNRRGAPSIAQEKFK